MALEMITLFIPLVTFAGNGFTVVRFQPSHLVAWDRQPEVPAEIQARMLTVVSSGGEKRSECL